MPRLRYEAHRLHAFKLRRRDEVDEPGTEAQMPLPTRVRCMAGFTWRPGAEPCEQIRKRHRLGHETHLESPWQASGTARRGYL